MQSSAPIVSVRRERNLSALVAATVVAASALFGASSVARAGAAAPIIPIVLDPAKADTFMTLVMPRAENEVERDRDAAKNDEMAADLAIRSASDREAQEKAEVEVQKAEVKRLEVEIGLAGDAKDETAKKAGEAKKKSAELRLKLLERRRDLRAAERELAQATKAAASGVVRACDRERELATKRVENPPFSATDASALARRLRWEADMRDLEKQTLETYRDASSKRKAVADRESDVISRRLDVLSVQREIITEASK